MFVSLGSLSGEEADIKVNAMNQPTFDQMVRNHVEVCLIGLLYIGIAAAILLSF